MDVSVQVVRDILIVAHTSRPIADAEWDGVLETSRRLLAEHNLVRVLVDAPGEGGGPSIASGDRPASGSRGVSSMSQLVVQQRVCFYRQSRLLETRRLTPA